MNSENAITEYRPRSLVMSEDGRKAVAAMRGAKLRDMQERELFLDCGRLLKHISVQVGCPIPSGEQDFRKASLRIMQHLKGYYGDMTVEEIKTAFELFSAGRLDQYFNRGLNGRTENPKHYGQLSPSYISSVLNAYNLIRSRAMYIQEMTRSVAYVSRIPPEERDRNDAQCRAWLCEDYDKWLETNEVKFATFATAKVYRDILVEGGWASPDTSPDSDAVIEGFDRIRGSGKDIREVGLF